MPSTKEHTYTVLCFAVSNAGRDIELMLPLRYFAETYLQCRFIHKTAYDIFAVYRYQPDIVFVPNTVGNYFYAEIAQYARQQNIKVFALYSEGDFRTDGTFDYWGDNTFREFVQEYVCMWNERTTRFLKQAEPQYAEKIVFTGGVGFDRYKMYQFLSKNEFLKKYKKTSYRKVIGYASWGVFGKLHHAEGLVFLNELFQGDEKILAWLEEQRTFVESVLRQTIENNPDTLFILKRHPVETYEHIQNREVLNDIINLQQYENVVYVRDEENIHDLIHVSDLWLGYESTTVLEAWLLDKTTVFINNDIDLRFKRSKYYEGCVLAEDYSQLQDFIDSFYQHGKLAAFEEKKQSREQMMEDVFGFSDGLNHVRAGYYFQKTLEKAKQERSHKRRKFSLRYFAMYLAMEAGKYFYSRALFQKVKKLSKTIWVFETYEQKGPSALYKKYYPYIKKYHQLHSIPEMVKNNSIESKLLERHTNPK